MQVTITIPDNLTERLEQKFGDLPQQILVGFALNSYQNRLISTYELGQILGLESIYETQFCAIKAPSLIELEKFGLVQN